MEHVIAIGGLALVCGLWFVVQRASGRMDEGGGGRCGACGEDGKESCKSKGEGAGSCERDP